MKIIFAFILLLLLLLYDLVQAQTKKIVVNKYSFIIKTKKIKNEWNTYDKVKELYRVENGKTVYLLKYFEFQDGGGDCNNLFWNKENLKVSHDSLVISTEYFQKTGNDPIPEYRRQVYKVDTNGKLLLVFDKYKYRHQTEWTDE